MGLEYEDNDLYNSFREFYVDTLPEFKSVGKVINFKVCCNHEAHLRGNVYVQYKRLVSIFFRDCIHCPISEFSLSLHVNAFICYTLILVSVWQMKQSFGTNSCKTNFFVE